MTDDITQPFGGVPFTGVATADRACLECGHLNTHAGYCTQVGRAAREAQSTMDYLSFTRRVWQRRHTLMVSNPSVKVIGLAVNYRDWINLVTDTEVGSPNCRLHCESVGGGVSQWYWEDIPLHTDSSLPLGTIEVRSAVQA